MPAHIEDYALIGDCETAALVSNKGSIDWLCWPTFASPACMAALLGDDNNGHWCIAPANEARSSRKYRDGTLIVETTFANDEGSVLLIDFMPIRGKYPIWCASCAACAAKCKCAWSWCCASTMAAHTLGDPSRRRKPARDLGA